MTVPVKAQSDTNKNQPDLNNQCATPHPQNQSFGPESTTCDVNLSELPIKTVRVTVHVFLKDDGTENIPNNTTGRNWITAMVNSVNSDMGNLSMMSLSTPSPYIQDCKIRYSLKNIYFWNNTTMWQKGNNTLTNGNALYSYIQGQSISYKSNSIHILIPGNYATDSLGASGIASGIGDKKWSLLEDVYHYYVNGNTWDIPNLLQHELGHNLYLLHSWPSNDECDDTPPNSNCWNGSGCSNNMMDENACKCALTLDQVSRMHVWLHTSGSALVQSGAYSGPTMAGTVSSAGYNGPLGCCTVNIGAPSATITITAPTGTSITWTKTSGTGTFTTASNGYTLNLSGVTSINMRATFEYNCVTFTKNYTFYNGGAFFSSGPNPTTGDLNITVTHEDELLYLASEVSGRAVNTYMETIVLRGKGGEIIFSEAPADKTTHYSKNIGHLETGTYFLEIRTGDLVVQHKIVKI